MGECQVTGCPTVECKNDKSGQVNTDCTVFVLYLYCTVLYTFWAINSPKRFLGANFRNIARMHNSTDYVTFLEKSLAPFLRKVAKTLLKGHFLRFFAKMRQYT